MGLSPVDFQHGDRQFPVVTEGKPDRFVAGKGLRLRAVAEWNRAKDGEQNRQDLTSPRDVVSSSEFHETRCRFVKEEEDPVGKAKPQAGKCGHLTSLSRRRSQAGRASEDGSQLSGEQKSDKETSQDRWARCRRRRRWRRNGLLTGRHDRACREQFYEVPGRCLDTFAG